MSPNTCKDYRNSKSALQVDKTGCSLLRLFSLTFLYYIKDQKKDINNPGDRVFHQQDNCASVF